MSSDEARGYSTLSVTHRVEAQVAYGTGRIAAARSERSFSEPRGPRW